MTQMIEFTQANRQSKFSRYAWVMAGMLDEVFDELSDGTVDEDKLETWFADFGRVIEWCGSGDASLLPESVRDFLIRNHGELLAIEA